MTKSIGVAQSAKIREFIRSDIHLGLWGRSAGMESLCDSVGEAGSGKTTAATSSAETRYRDALRLLFILVAGADEADEPASDTVKIFRAEKRLMAMDFLVRYPDYLADALLDLVEAEADEELLKKAQGIFKDDEPSVRLVRMVRWKRGAYENIEDALSLLSYYGLVQSMQLKGVASKGWPRPARAGNLSG